MGITIHPETTKNPITLIGEFAGACWRADTSDPEKNYKRGMDCILSDHGRTLEFPDIYAIFDGYSARVIREWYTHIGGAPTRLQESTRYIPYYEFEYYIPPSIDADEEALALYENTMNIIRQAVYDLETLYLIPREDAANLYPLGMMSHIVDKRNARNVVDMSYQRLCTRAYHEFRKMFKEYLDALCKYSSEWETFIGLTMKPKCELYGHCPEKHSCGYMEKKNEKKD